MAFLWLINEGLLSLLAAHDRVNQPESYYGKWLGKPRPITLSAAETKGLGGAELLLRVLESRVDFTGFCSCCSWCVFIYIWLVVSTHLKNISQIGNLPRIGVKIQNIWNQYLDMISRLSNTQTPPNQQLTSSWWLLHNKRTDENKTWQCICCTPEM